MSYSYNTDFDRYDDCIPITQFMRPDGRKRDQWAPISPKYIELAKRFVTQGGYYTAEHLTTGQVALYACINEEDVAIEICPNGPEVEQALEKVIDRSINHITS